MKSIIPWGKYSRGIGDFWLPLHKKSEKRESLMFKKYFPKFVRELKMISADPSTISKVKATKIISVINTSYYCLKLRLILANKIKLVKSLKNNLPSQELFAERVSLFPNLESIIIQKPRISSSRLTEAEEVSLVQACKMMKYAKKLKRLEIKELSRGQNNFIDQLNSSPRLLKALESLKVLFYYEKPWEYFQRINSTKDFEPVEILERNKTFLKYITELDLGVLCSNRVSKSFEGFANACPKLASSSLAFSHSSSERRIVGCPFSVNANYLQTIETFKNLRDLNLHIGDILTFLQGFAAPFSLKNLEFRFEEQFSNRIMLKIDNNYTETQMPKVFRGNKLMLEFYGRFQQLKNLDSLKLFFNKNSDLDAFRCQSYFVQSLLKRTSSRLQKLILNPLCSLPRPLEREDRYGFKVRLKEVNDSFLPQVFESCCQFSQALQSLQIGSEKTVYSYLDLSPFHGKFPQLSSVQIFCKFKGGYDKEMEISEFLSQIIPLGDALKIIKIYTFAENKVSFLLTILRQIRQRRIPEKLQIQLYIAFPDFEYLESPRVGCYNVIRELQNEKIAMGISLKIYTDARSEGVRKFLEAYEEKFERFKCCSSEAYCPSNWLGQEDNFDS